MIFVTVGTQLAFDRLIGAVDEWAGRARRDDVFAQIGPSQLQPRHMRNQAFLSPDEFAQHFAQADLVIAHAGMGSIISAMSQGKPILVMPRSAQLNEHRNDHQIATARRFSELGSVMVAMDVAELDAHLDRLAEIPAAAPIGLHASPRLVTAVRSFIEA